MRDVPSEGHVEVGHPGSSRMHDSRASMARASPLAVGRSPGERRRDWGLCSQNRTSRLVLSSYRRSIFPVHVPPPDP
jgi:hypothetical protein